MQCAWRKVIYFYSWVAHLNSRHFQALRCSIVNTFCLSFSLFPVDVSVYNCRKILPWSQSFEPCLARLRSGIMSISFGPQINHWNFSFCWDFKIKDKFYVVRWPSIIGQMGNFCKFALWFFITNFYVLLTVHLSMILDNDQLDTHLLYFTIRLL